MFSPTKFQMMIPPRVASSQIVIAVKIAQT